MVPLASNGIIGKITNGTIGRTPNRAFISKSIMFETGELHNAIYIYLYLYCITPSRGLRAGARLCGVIRRVIKIKKKFPLEMLVRVDKR